MSEDAGEPIDFDRLVWLIYEALWDARTTNVRLFEEAKRLASKINSLV